MTYGSANVQAKVSEFIMLMIVLYCGISMRCIDVSATLTGIRLHMSMDALINSWPLNSNQ